MAVVGPRGGAGAHSVRAAEHKEPVKGSAGLQCLGGVTGRQTLLARAARGTRGAGRA